MQSITYDELMRQKERIVYNNEIDCTFRPVVNKNSHMICSQKAQGSHESINNQLYNVRTQLFYQEAFERKAKNQQQEERALNEVKQQANKTKIDLNSQVMILQKKERYLQEFLQQCTTDVYIKNYPQNQVSKDELNQILQLLGVFSTIMQESNVQSCSQRNTNKFEHKKQNLLNIFWNLISFQDEEKQYVSDFIVFNFLIVLLESQLNTKQTKVLLVEALKKEMNDSECEITTVISEQIEQLICEFKFLLEQNRTQIESGMIKKSSRKAIIKQETFHPVICEKSKVIDMQIKQNDSNGGQNRYEQLFLYAKHLEDKKAEQLFTSNQLKEDPQCSFQPQINKRASQNNENEEIHSRLYNFASKFKNHKEELKQYYQDQEDHKEMEQCTFKPKTNNTFNTKVQPQVKGTKAVLERQEKARQLKYDKENYFTIKDQKLQERDSHRSTKIEPFQLQTPQIDVRKVVVYVDVRISKSKKIRIALKEQDDPKMVAKNFARIHSLNSQMLTILEDMLEGYMLQFNQKDPINLE